MRALVFDPFAGVSGDMILGALVDVGLPVDWLTGFVRSLDLGDVRVVTQRAQRRGIACASMRFELPTQTEHRHLRDILAIIERTPASRRTRDVAMAVFRRLADAEARVHGTSVDEVHFHEVGALDAVLDVLCAVAGIEQLGFEACFTRPIAVGTGWVETAHGRLPLPAPATLNLLEGFPVRETSLQGECTTPTGAAILTTLVGEARATGDVVLGRTGYGAGTRDPADRPNCLRLTAVEVTGGGAQAFLLVQSDIDDMAPEYVPAAQEALLEAGAADAVVSAIGMKKGRPGFRIEALVAEPELDAVLTALFRSTSTIGARYWSVSRPALPRWEEVVEWRGHRVRRKRVRLPDGTERAKVEFDDVVRVARAMKLTAHEVQSALERESPAALEALDDA